MIPQVYPQDLALLDKQRMNRFYLDESCWKSKSFRAGKSRRSLSRSIQCFSGRSSLLRRNRCPWSSASCAVTRYFLLKVAPSKMRKATISNDRPTAGERQTLRAVLVRGMQELLQAVFSPSSSSCRLYIWFNACRISLNETHEILWKKNRIQHFDFYPRG